MGNLIVVDVRSGRNPVPGRQNRCCARKDQCSAPPACQATKSARRPAAKHLRIPHRRWHASVRCQQRAAAAAPPAAYRTIYASAAAKYATRETACQQQPKSKAHARRAARHAAAKIRCCRRPRICPPSS
ncbi:hypothetical protein NPIL_135741 [Nephila pilipes]|uniref:Uncharacterized protein n=1 Tax=Nephila pilipes TaxID=299642 RepID=A0A8X6NVZ8_NEPPI|nr:hypothetical protein NPIL_135741 [Nephila pilipes]